MGPVNVSPDELEKGLVHAVTRANRAQGLRRPEDVSPDGARERFERRLTGTPHQTSRGFRRGGAKPANSTRLARIRRISCCMQNVCVPAASGLGG